VAKRFDEIPMADIEMVFPDKRFYFKPLLLIQLSVTILGGLVAAVSAMAARPQPPPHAPRCLRERSYRRLARFLSFH
jgi:hypothetical protein